MRIIATRSRRPVPSPINAKPAETFSAGFVLLPEVLSPRNRELIPHVAQVAHFDAERARHVRHEGDGLAIRETDGPRNEIAVGVVDVEVEIGVAVAGDGHGRDSPARNVSWKIMVE